jgi:hypothetical protein
LFAVGFEEVPEHEAQVAQAVVGFKQHYIEGVLRGVACQFSQRRGVVEGFGQVVVSGAAVAVCAVFANEDAPVLFAVFLGGS